MLLPFLFFFYLASFDQKILALTYNDKCTKTCDLPGLICTNGQCKCDVKNRLFWTGSRCASCPKDWTMTETACISLYETKMNWETAKSTCRKVEAELISFRSRNIIPLIYNTMRIRNVSDWYSQTSAWTSAHATDLTGFGEYRWLDQTMKPFNNQSDWWCRKSTKNLGYNYPYDEPTRLRRNNSEIEACVIYWRGTEDTQVLCLDDQLCSHQYLVMCEKSESTAAQYLGPPPTQNNQLTPLNPSINNGINTGSTAAMKSDSQKKLLGLIAGIIVVLLLLALLGGFLCYYKRRNARRKQLDLDRPSKVTHTISKISGISDNNIIIKDDLAFPPAYEKESGPIMGEQKQQKSKRGGYSKQQFDEFE